MSTEEAKNNSPGDDGRYEEFLRGVELINIGLKRCSANLDRIPFFKLYAKEKARPVRSVRDSYKITHVGKRFFEASGAFNINLRESAEADPILTVECEFEAHLHGPEPIPEEFLQRFVQSEFKLILIPYARQFVSSLTATMSIPPLVIPLSISKPKEVTPEKKVRSRVKAR